MIYEIYSNNSQFKPISFKKGLNIILADSEKNSGDQNSRNGLGKTTLIHIIHFCLGSKPNKDRIPFEDIDDWIFYIKLDLFGRIVLASRSVKNEDIVIVEGNLNEFPIKPKYDTEGDFQFYEVNNWNELLGKALFDLEETSNFKYKPTFRTLIPYFIRRTAFEMESPFINENNKHKTVNWKVCTSFCLGLDWKLISKYQEFQDENKKLNKRNNLLQEGLQISRGKLVPEQIRLKKEVKEVKNELTTFKVLPSYKSTEKNANELTKEIHDLVNKSSFLNKQLQRYEETITQEKEPNLLNLEILYKDAGLLFPENVKKTLKDAKIFHSDLIENRKKFLESEIDDLKFSLSEIDEQISQKSESRSNYMKILKNFGALQEYTEIQGIYSEKKQRLEEVNSRISEFESISKQKKIIKQNLLALESRFEIDYDENRIHWEKSIELFSENSDSLYNTPGNLIINQDKGYDFEIEIPRGKSSGISKMIVFCYDLMLVETFCEQNKIDFLIHDSTIFADVDSRQYARALKLAHQKGMKKEFQYICTINSDTIPHKYLENFDINQYVRLTLHDNSPEDSLLGFEF